MEPQEEGKRGGTEEREGERREKEERDNLMSRFFQIQSVLVRTHNYIYMIPFGDISRRKYTHMYIDVQMDKETPLHVHAYIYAYSHTSHIHANTNRHLNNFHGT